MGFKFLNGGWNGILGSFPKPKQRFHGGTKTPKGRAPKMPENIPGGVRDSRGLFQREPFHDFQGDSGTGSPSPGSLRGSHPARPHSSTSRNPGPAFLVPGFGIQQGQLLFPTKPALNPMEGATSALFPSEIPWEWHQEPDPGGIILTPHPGEEIPGAPLPSIPRKSRIPPASEGWDPGARNSSPGTKGHCSLWISSHQHGILGSGVARSHQILGFLGGLSPNVRTQILEL